MPIEKIIQIYNIFFHNFRTFDKSMTLKDFIKYKVDDDFAYLVIEDCNDQFYRFNLRNKEEKYQATNIVRDYDCMLSVGKYQVNFLLW